MVCKNCGNEVNGNKAFCSNCGAKIGTVTNNNENKKISREEYIGKSYTFDNYILLNIRSLRLSRRAVGFDDDHLVYCRGFNREQIPYNMIKEIKDEIKINLYTIICIIILIILTIIGLSPVLSAILILICLFGTKYRQITIILANNKNYVIKTVPKNKEIDQFLAYLKNESDIM